MTELEQAMESISSGMNRVARLMGSVPDDYFINTWALAGAAQSLEQDDTILFVIPGAPMANWQLHGLLDMVDNLVCSDELHVDDYDSDEER
jgi:hypothetical protein